MSTPSIDPAPPAAPRLGVFGRLVASFVAPVELFTDLRRRAGFVVPLLLVAAIAAGAQVVLSPRLDVEAAVRAQLEKSGSEVPEEVVDKAVAQASAFRKFAPIISGATTPILMAIVAVALFLGLRLLGSSAGYPATLSATSWAFVPPSLVGGIIGSVVALRHTRIDPANAEYLVRSSLAAFLPQDTSAALRALAGALDVFSVWTVVLLVLAVSYTGGVRRGRAIWLVVGLWSAWVSVRVALGAVQDAFA